MAPFLTEQWKLQQILYLVVKTKIFIAWPFTEKFTNTYTKSYSIL